MSLTLVFWNCGVEPARGKGKRLAADAARFINDQLGRGVDLVAVCEVGPQSFSTIKGLLGKRIRGTKIVDKAGGSRWDFGIFYRTTQILTRKGAPIKLLEAGETVKSAHSIKVLHRDGSPYFDLFLSHWRSRLQASGVGQREKAANLLWETVRKANRAAVLMGDYNDEPFDNSMHKLRTSRDPAHVIRNPNGRLYNVTWRLCAPPENNPWDSFGTLKGSKDSHSERVLFDQALTTAHFLDADAKTAPTARILPCDLPTEDHLPVEITLP